MFLITDNAPKCITNVTNALTFDFVLLTCSVSYNGMTKAMLSLVDSVSLRPLSGKVHTTSQQGYVESTLITDANHLFQTNDVLCQLTVDSDTASYSELCPAVQRKRLNF